MEPNLKDQVISLWQEGQSGGKIAESLNITRNSVMGIIHRAKRDGMNLRGGPRVNVATKKPEELTPKPEEVAEIEIEKTQLIFSPQPKAAPKPETGKILDDLKHGDCRYIVSTHDTYGAVYCAEPIHKDSYCTDHAKLCYITPSR